ncbi:MAG TPA: hypothetical protein ENI49_05470 [Thermoplasmatales archaeon]|nr:hypothetical protein [Thermoplasmatales archaeon]
MSKNILYDDCRRLLWDHIIDRTGLNNLNLINSYSLIKNKIIQHRADFNYLIYNGRAKKCAEEIIYLDRNLFKEADEIIKKLGIKKSKQYDFDTYYGLLISYAWHKDYFKQNVAAGYIPIYYLIDKLKDKFPDKEDTLSIMYRRLVYLFVISEEFQYLREKFDYDAIDILLDWTANKFEHFTTTVTELALFVTAFYYDTHPDLDSISNSDCRFGKIFDLTRKISSDFNCINHAIYCLLAVELRNCIAHRTDHEFLRKENNKIIIAFERDLNKKYYQYQILKEWIEKRINDRFAGRKIPNEWHELRDPVFKFVTWKVRIKKNGRFDMENVKIVFHIELEEYVDLMVKTFLYSIFNKLFKNLIEL